jgi:hypothetical protein
VLLLFVLSPPPVDLPCALVGMDGATSATASAQTHMGSLEITGGPQTSFDDRSDYRIRSSRQALDPRANPMKSFMGMV